MGLIGLVALSLFAIAVGYREALKRDFAFASGEKPPSELGLSEEAMPQVEVIKVRAIEVPEHQTFTGTINASLAADVSSKIMGKVVAVYVREGDQVKAGQILVQLDNSDLLAQVRQAQAAVEATKAALSQAEIALNI